MDEVPGQRSIPRGYSESMGYSGRIDRSSRDYPNELRGQRHGSDWFALAFWEGDCIERL